MHVVSLCLCLCGSGRSDGETILCERSNKENSHIPSVGERPTHIHPAVHTAPAAKANKGKDDEAIVFNSANKRPVTKHLKSTNVWMRRPWLGFMESGKVREKSWPPPHPLLCIHSGWPCSQEYRKQWPRWRSWRSIYWGPPSAPPGAPEAWMDLKKKHHTVPGKLPTIK